MSIERAKQLQNVVNTASGKMQQATDEYNKQNRRFKDCIERTIESDPQLLKTDGWLMHHAINTLEWNCDKIASVMGVSRESLLADVY